MLPPYRALYLPPLTLSGGCCQPADLYNNNTHKNNSDQMRNFDLVALVFVVRLNVLITRFFLHFIPITQLLSTANSKTGSAAETS